MMFVAPYCETQMPILSSLAFDDIGEPQWHVRYRHVQRWLEGVSVSSVWDCFGAKVLMPRLFVLLLLRTLGIAKDFRMNRWKVSICSLISILRWQVSSTRPGPVRMRMLSLSG
jgi:hypothetical protein